MELFKLFGTILVNNDKANDSIHKTEKIASSSGEKISGAFKKVGAAIVAAFSVKEMIDFGKQCIDAYNVQVEAETKLETVMRQRMNASDESIQSIKDLASEQQKLGVVGDEVQLSGAQQLSTFLKTDSALKTLIPAMNNLGVQQHGVNVTGQDMVNIGNLMGKAMQGQTGALTRVGITFDESQEKVMKYGTEEERAAMLAEIITQNVGEMNQKLAETDEGKQQQLKNTLGDIQETIGQRLIPIQNVWYQALTVLATFLADRVLPVMDNAIQFATNLANSFSQNTEVMNTLQEAWTNIGIPMIEQIKMMGQDLADFVTLLWTSYGQPIFNGILSMAQTVYEQFLVIWPSIQNLIDTVWGAIKVAWETVLKPVFDFIVKVVLDVFNIFNQYWPQISAIVGEACDVISNFINTVLVPVFQAAGDFIQNVLLPVFETVWSGIENVIGGTIDAISNLWENSLKPVFDGIIDFLQGVFTGNWSQAMEGIKEICSGTWEGIKEAIERPMEAAGDFIEGVIDNIKSMFDFTITWPDIPLPVFSISPEGWELGDLLDGVIPSLGLDWKADGGVMMSPTIFGYNPQSGNLMAGGEAGPEAIAPIDVMQDYVRDAVNNSDIAYLLNSKFDKLFGIFETYFPQFANQQIMLDGKALVGQTAGRMDEALGAIQKRKAW